jgi:hypothetical protein
MKISDAPEIHTAGKEQEYLSWSYRDLVYNPEAITEADITLLQTREPQIRI